MDIGAYNAYYALMFAKLTQECVLSYDPDPDAVARSRRNLALNPTFAPLIELHAVAVGARPGPGAVTLDAELMPRTQHMGPAAWMLKIDVDGGELGVLSGAAGFLALMRPHVIVETHAPELEDACGAVLLEAGYSPRVLTQRKLLPSDRSWPPGTPGHNRWLVAVGGGRDTRRSSPRSGRSGTRRFMAFA